MSWLRELNGVVQALPKLQRAILLGMILVVLGAFAVPFFQLGRFSILRGSDSTGYYLWLRSAMVDGDWDFTNDLKICNTLQENYRTALLELPLTETGHWPNKYGIGWAVLSTPFYVMADGVVAAGRAAGWWDLERDGYNAVYQIFIHTGHFLLGLTGLLLAWRCVRHWCGDATAALWGVLLILVAGPQLYYLTLKLSLSHNAAFFAIALLTWACLEADKQPGRLWPWVVAGAAWGLALTLRFQLAIFGLLPAWVWWLQWRKGGDAGACRSGIAWLVGAIPWLLLQGYAWRVVYGHWVIFSYGVEGEGFNWLNPELFNVLFSPFHGFFYWHPFLVFGAIGFGWLVLQRGGMLVAASGAIVVTYYVNAAWWCWWFAGSFGSRAFEAVLLFFMAGLAILLVRLTSFWRCLLGGVGVLACLWNVALMGLYYAGIIERNAPVTWAKMIEASVQTLRSLLP